jgi:hypothetical protein
LKDGLPASLRDVYGSKQDDLIFGDPPASDPPVWFLTGKSISLLSYASKMTAKFSHTKKETYIQKPAHRARDTLYKFLKGYRVVRWGLVPGHYLRTPVAVTWPLKERSAHHLSKACGSLRRGLI